MSLAQLINAHYTNKVRPYRLKQFVLPQDAGTACGGETAAADGAGMVYGAWVNVADKTLITVDTLVVGILVDTPNATQVYTIDIGSTLVTVTLAGVTTTTNYLNAGAIVGAGPIAAAHRCEIRKQIASNAGTYLPTMLPFPVYYPANTGILARISTVNAVADEANISVLCIQNFE